MTDHVTDHVTCECRLFVCPEGSSLDYVISQYDKYSSLVPKVHMRNVVCVA